MKRKIILVFAVFALTAGMAAYFKTQAGTSHNVEGTVWSGSEDCDMDKNGWRDVLCGGDNTSTPVGETGDGSVNGNEIGMGWVNLNSLTCDSDSDNRADSSSPVGCPQAGTQIADYGVNVPTASGILSGYAWSSNYGWISFESGDLEHCPSSTTTPTTPCSARRVGDKIEGWARILSIKEAYENGNSGGWQGWIRLAGPGNLSGQLCDHERPNNYQNNNKCNYGVKIINTPDDSAYEDLDGYAWSDEVGWIRFKGSLYKGKIKFDSSFKVCPETNFVNKDSSVALKAWYNSAGTIQSCEGIEDQPGNEDVTNISVWSSSDSGVASVVQGVVLGVEEGIATITASHLSLSASAQLIVIPSPVCSCDETKAARVCIGRTFNNTCDQPVCQGTKDCSRRWREVQP